jgi:hypothetical protein
MLHAKLLCRELQVRHQTHDAGELTRSGDTIGVIITSKATTAGSLLNCTAEAVRFKKCGSGPTSIITGKSATSESTALENLLRDTSITVGIAQSSDAIFLMVGKPYDLCTGGTVKMYL